MDLDSYFAKVDESAKWLEQKIPAKPTIAVVLSGGLSAFTDVIDDKVVFSASEIPNFPRTRVEGHEGQLIFGKMKDVGVCALKGRYHYYEGHAPQAIVFPYFVLAAIGLKSLLTTNAVGGINASYKPGDIMMVGDHINMMGMNPLVGLTMHRPKDQFPSMTNAYDEGLRRIAAGVAQRLGIKLHEGVYVATSGPSYETKAEIRAFRQLGADTVGMSTVPAVIAANYLGVKVLTFSCIANYAADLHHGKMSHKEVLEAMNALSPKVVKLLIGCVEEIIDKKSF